MKEENKFSSHNQSSIGKLRGKVTWPILPSNAYTPADGLLISVDMSAMRDSPLNPGISDNENILPQDLNGIHFYFHLLFLCLSSGTV